MKNIVLLALVAFIIWLAATGKLMAWYQLATQKATSAVNAAVPTVAP